MREKPVLTGYLGITVIPRDGYAQDYRLRFLRKILVGKQVAFIYVLYENGQWKDRQISLLNTVETLYNGHNGDRRKWPL